MADELKINFDEVKGEFNKISESVEQVKKDSLNAVEGIKTELNTKLDDHKKQMDEIEGKIGMITTSQSSMNDKKGGYKNHIDFFNDVITAGKNDNRPDKMPERLAALFNTVGSDEARISSNPDGGFLIPEDFLAGLLSTDPQALQNDTGAMTRKIPMTSPIVRINARVDKNHASSVSGGFRVYRREEAAEITSSKATYEQIKLEANSLAGLAFATEEVLAQSPISFAAMIQSGFEDEKKSKLNYERLWGTGVGEFLGVMNSGAKVEIAKESNQTADTINGTNIIKMRARIWGYNDAVWMLNQDCLTSIVSAHIAGTNGDQFLFAPGNGTDKPDTLLGRPVIWDENMATLGDAGDIALINWKEYLEGMVGGVNFMESIHVRFVNNERAFRFTMYNDGAPWWKTALTPKKSSVTLSPFVTLAERS